MKQERITPTEFTVQEIVEVIGRVSDLLNDPDIDRDDKIVIMEECGWAIGELHAICGGAGDELDIDFGLMIR